MSRRSQKSVFRSKFEENVSKVLKGFEYEPFTIPYVIHRNYRPDFVHAATGTVVECKGFFREGDTKKYTSVRDSLKKIRKGATMTMAEWCDKEGIMWYTIDTVQELISDVSNNG
jgi:hypothetical protein